MTSGNRIASVLTFVMLVAAAAVALYWVDAIGGFVIGGRQALGLLLFGGPAFLLCWLIYLLIASYGISTKWHLALVVVLTIAAVPVGLQPWNPRHDFVSRLRSLTPGKTEQDVRRAMGGYLGGDQTRAWSSYVPEEHQGKGVTHVISYRWNDTDARYNADSGQVFLRDGVVVGTRFLPD